MLELSFFSLLWLIIKVLLALVVGWLAVRLIIWAVPVIALWIMSIRQNKK